MEEADPRCAAMEWECSWWPLERSSHRNAWQLWSSLSPQNNLMALLRDINKEECISFMSKRQKGCVNTLRSQALGKINRWSQRNQNTHTHPDLRELDIPGKSPKTHTARTAPPYTGFTVPPSLYSFHRQALAAVPRWECWEPGTECLWSITEHLFCTADILPLACSSAPRCWRWWTGSWHSWASQIWF